jgi:hypothetical protein
MGIKNLESGAKLHQKKDKEKDKAFVAANGIQRSEGVKCARD